MLDVDFPETKIKGSLQLKIMFLLNESPLCGTDIMKKLSISGPDTVYPVSHSLEEKRLVSFEMERTGDARKKSYKLTEKGTKELVERG